MPRGGFRPGAGRKPTREKFKHEVAAAEQRIADRLPTLIANLEKRADGGYEMVTIEEVPAGTVFVDQYDPGDDGRVIRTKVCAFPNLAPEQLVVIKRTTQWADSDVKANVYLVDRIMASPARDVMLSGADGGPIDLEVTDGSRLSDNRLAAAVDRLLDRGRARTPGAADQPQPDLGTAPGPTA